MGHFDQDTIKKSFFERAAILVVLVALFRLLVLTGTLRLTTQAPITQEKVITEPNASKDFESLRKMNLDIVGWICITGTNIDYPIVQAVNNSYYTDHAFNRKKSKSGAIFLDYSSNQRLTDGISIIYGHRMNDGSMFANLLKYRNEEYLAQHKNILIYTPEAKLTYEIFSAFVLNSDDALYHLELDEQNIDSSVEKLRAASLHKTLPMVSGYNRFIVLSTCTKRKNKRFVVCGRLIEEMKYIQTGIEE